MEPAHPCRPTRPLCDFTDRAHRRGRVGGTDEKHNPVPRRSHLSEDPAQGDGHFFFFEHTVFATVRLFVCVKIYSAKENLEQL